MKRALIFVLLYAIEQTLSSQNLVVNPGLVNWQNTSKPSGWIHSENCLKDSVNVYSGNYSCQHSGGTTTSDLGQVIPITPGKEYSLSAFYKTVVTSSGNGARIWCYWRGSDGSNLTDPATDDILRPSKYMKSDNWNQVSINITAPVEAVAFYLEVRTYPNSVAWWDSFVFEEKVISRSSWMDMSGVKIFPNPAYDYLNISSAGDFQHFDILNSDGVTLISSGVNGNKMISIPVAYLPDGIYFVRLFKFEMVTTKKFIKQSR